MEINLEIGKYSDLQDLGKFEKIQFSSIDEAISTFEFLKLGYNSFGKDRTSLMVRLEEGSKPFLLDYNSILPIKEIREDLEKKYGKLEHKEDEIEFKILEKKEKISLNSNFKFEESENTKYAKTTAGFNLPFKLFRTDDTGFGTNLLRETQNSGDNTDFALIERRFTESKTLQFFGSEKIENHNDIAWLFNSLEDEAIEHAFLVYDFEDKGYFIQHISTGTFNQALIDNKQIIGNILEANPSSITLVHNHPSGNLKASKGDANVLEKLKKALQNTDIKVNDGIIINLRSGKYLVFNEKFLEEQKQRETTSKQLLEIQSYSFSKQVLVENYQPIQVKSPEDVAAYITSQKFGVSDKNEMLLLNLQLNIIGKFILPANNQENFIVEKVSKFGGSNCILYGNNITPELVDFYSKRLEHSNITITDAILLKSENGQKMWESFMNEGKMVQNHNAKTDYFSENYNSKFNKMEESKLSSFDKIMIPKTQGYKNFVKELENNPNEFLHKELSERQKKYLNVYDVLKAEKEMEKFDNAKYLVITYQNNEPINTREYDKLSKAAESFNKIDLSGISRIEFKDQSTNFSININNNVEKEKFLSDLWAKELSKKSDLSSGLTKNQIDEKQAYHYRNYETEAKKIGIETTPFNEIKTEKGDIQKSKGIEVVGGKIKDIADEAIRNPDSLKQYDENTQNVINLYINKNQNIMENQKEFDQVQYLKDQMKYLGFGEGEKLHKDLEVGINSSEKEFQINTTSDKTLPGNKADFTLNFKKSEQGGVFLNSYNAELKKDNGEILSQKFPIRKDESFSAKEAINLLEGRSVKIEFNNPKTEQRETSFVQLDFNADKNEYGNYNFKSFHQNYGVNTADIVEKSNLVFDKPEYKDNTIKNLEKGNVVKVKFEMGDNVVEGKAVLNPQYKNLSLYDNDMNRMNTNEPIKGLEADQKHEKNNVREQSMSRGI